MAASKKQTTKRQTTKNKNAAKELFNTPIKRRTLTREAILRRALVIVDDDGLSGLTVRKLAEQLDVSATAVYRHFQNKAEITGGLVDLVVGDYDVTDHQEPEWQEWICTTFFLMHQALCDHPGIISTLGNTNTMGNNALGVMEQILQTLQSVGYDDTTAVQLFHMLMAYTIGTTIMTAHRENKVATSTSSSPFAQIPQVHFPNTIKLAPHLTAVINDTHFRRDLLQILVSVKQKK